MGNTYNKIFTNLKASQVSRLIFKFKVRKKNKKKEIKLNPITTSLFLEYPCVEDRSREESILIHALGADHRISRRKLPRSETL